MKIMHYSFQPKNSHLFTFENTLVDQISSADDSTLLKFSLKKGDFHSAKNSEMLKALSLELRDSSIQYGGSGANTACGYANLGLQASFLGSIGNDSYGLGFRESLVQSSVKPYLAVREKDNGICYTLITPDKERTFLVAMGASSDVKPHELPDDILAESGIFHSTAYALDSMYEAFDRALGIAKKNGVKVSFDVASQTSIQRHRLKFERIFANTDILFLNNEEAAAFGYGSYDELFNDMHEKYNIGLIALKLGSKGALLSSNEGQVSVKAYKADVVNTNGAGDGFAAGLLYGISKGYGLPTSGKIAAYYASRIVAQQPTRLNYKINNILDVI